MINARVQTESKAHEQEAIELKSYFDEIDKQIKKLKPSYEFNVNQFLIDRFVNAATWDMFDQYQTQLLNILTIVYQSSTLFKDTQIQQNIINILNFIAGKVHQFQPLLIIDFIVDKFEKIYAAMPQKVKDVLEAKSEKITTELVTLINAHDTESGEKLLKVFFNLSLELIENQKKLAGSKTMKSLINKFSQDNTVKQDWHLSMIRIWLQICCMNKAKKLMMNIMPSENTVTSPPPSYLESSPSCLLEEKHEVTSISHVEVFNKLKLIISNSQVEYHKTKSENNIANIFSTFSQFSLPFFNNQRQGRL